ncbi:hypothetical protein ACEWY4_015224 [Coilia grayii]|uniref:Ig-like domain-containing protein n=1 Tax=Coilia grayii TaxID=363190 RepID=A0ABD1JMD4_9TELE
MEITWKTPDQLVANFSKGVFSCGTGFENRVRFENVHSKGGFSLHINPVVFSDTDTYSCFNTTHLIKTWNLVVTVSPPKEVHVIERGTATLPCYGAISRRLVNEQLNVHWKKDGYAVLNLTKGATHHYPGFGYRANMLLHDIRQGDFSMVIKNVEMTDDGNYECFTENNEGKILNSVKLRVLKGIHHGYRQLVSDFTGNYFTFYVSSADVEVYLLREKIAEKKNVCRVRDTVATCNADISQRTVMNQGYLTLKDLTEEDKGVYQVVDAGGTIVTEIVLEVRHIYSIGKFLIFLMLYTIPNLRNCNLMFVCLFCSNDFLYDYSRSRIPALLVLLEEDHVQGFDVEVIK